MELIIFQDPRFTYLLIVGNSGLVRVLENKLDFITFYRNPLNYGMALGLECSGLDNITASCSNLNNTRVAESRRNSVYASLHVCTS